MSVNKNMKIKLKKNLKQPIRKVKFNIDRLMNNEKTFNINKHWRQLKKNNTKTKIIDEKIRKGFE